LLSAKETEVRKTKGGVELYEFEEGGKGILHRGKRSLYLLLEFKREYSRELGESTKKNINIFVSTRTERFLRL